MTAYLISLALIGLIAIAVWEDLMSADIIQFIPRPRNDQEQTDFPTIAFRSAVHDLASDVSIRRHASMSCRKGATPECQKPSPDPLAGAEPHQNRNHCPRQVMQSEDATPAARVSAANAILDRGWGKAPQPSGVGMTA